MENRYSNRLSIGFSPFTLLAMLKLLSETFIQDILLRFPGRLIFEIADISFWREIYRGILRLGNEFLYKIENLVNDMLRSNDTECKQIGTDSLHVFVSSYENENDVEKHSSKDTLQ